MYIAKLTLDALKARRQQIAFDANLQKAYQVNTPYAVKCLEEYERLTRLIEQEERPRQLGLGIT